MTIDQHDPTAPPVWMTLSAGPLTMVLDPRSGFLRYITCDGAEVVRGIYAAVRDRNWDTVAPTVSNLTRTEHDGGFEVSFDVACGAGAISFDWAGRITGTPDGVVRYAMRGRAGSTFMRNRIGFCVLHPGAAAGLACVVEATDSTRTAGRFPREISPHQPFKQLVAITHEVRPGLSAEVRFAGDVFEMEDQRNWTDGSFKTYCTPLDLPFPVEVREGTEIEQRVVVTVRAAASNRPRGRAAEREVVRVTLEDRTILLPAIGLMLNGDRPSLTAGEAERLRRLNLSHLRVDAWPATAPTAIARAAAAARQLGVGLEVAVYLTDTGEAELSAVADVVTAERAPVVRWLVHGADRRLPPTRWLATARRILTRAVPTAPIVAGTDAYFAELNRNRPPLDELDGVCYSINPQVHAFDDASLVESLEAQGDTVRSAAAIAVGRSVVVSPVTFRPRFNPNATAAEPEPPSGEMPRHADPRQAMSFGAAWTVGSIKHLAEAGIASVTYYDAVGPAGVIRDGDGARGDADGGSDVMPLYHVLADIGEFVGGAVRASRSSDPLAVQSLVLEKEGRTRLVLANLSRDPRRATVALSHATRTARLHRLIADASAPFNDQSRSAHNAAAALIVAGRAGVEVALPRGAVALVDAG